MANLSDLFIGDPKWRRPTPGANRCVVLAGTSCCICVPNTATRVVVEMWGQGGNGGGGRCCTWGATGGQGGSYASKVWEGTSAPATTGQCMLFCGCVCACDCKVSIGNGSAGQFSRLTNCNASGGAGIGGWIGCVNGGAGGCQCCAGAASWPCCACKYNPGYDIQCVSATTTVLPDYYQIACMSTAQSTACDGGSQLCCAGASCYCATNYCSFTCTGHPHCRNEVCTVAAGGGEAFTFDQIFVKVSCACFDNYRLGACGWSKAGNPTLGGCTIWNYCDIGVGGAAYAGGCQQKNNFSMGNYAYCGFAGNFPGGGGKTSAACGGGCCCGSIGGAGLILVSWD